MDRQPRAPRARYDGTAATWRAAYGSADPFGHRLQRRRDAVVAAVRRHLGGRRARLLDAGCGTGEIADALRAEGHEVVALDASTEMLRAARELLTSDPQAGAACVQGTVGLLPFRSSSFDAVLCVGVMGHLPRGRGEAVDPAACALGELTRVVKPGGFLVVSVSNLFRVSWLIDLRELGRALRHRRRVQLQAKGTRRFTPGEWRRFVSARGLHIVDWRGVGFGPFSLLGREILSPGRSNRMSDAIERLARILTPLNRLGAHCITTLAPEPAALAAAARAWELRLEPRVRRRRVPSAGRRVV